MVNKLGLSGAGVLPLLFAFIREATAAPVLFAMVCAARRKERRGAPMAADADYVEAATGVARPRAAAVGEPEERGPKHGLALRLLPGVLIFAGQLCSLTGVALSDPVSAAAWQPSQVVFTMIICACLGMEELTAPKVATAVLTVAGALCLVFLGGHRDGGEGGWGQLHQVVRCTCMCTQEGRGES